MENSLIKQITELKKKKNAIILAHNYQIMEVQGVADFVGDSLQLAREAAHVKADIILFCGVQFMAETAKLLNPKASVLLSVKAAGCPMADMISGAQLLKFKAKYANPTVVCYVNSSVEVKAESDLCCTSGNAIKVVKSIPGTDKILFVPDQNLGTYVARKTKRDITVWQGYCNVHHVNITAEDVKKVKQKYPDYTLMVHPECKPEVFEQADIVASTKGMSDFVKENDHVIIGTEIGLYHQLKQLYPQKNIAPLSQKAICYNMKKTTLEDVYQTLLNEKNEIIIDSTIANKAVQAIHRMLSIS